MFILTDQRMNSIAREKIVLLSIYCQYTIVHAQNAIANAATFIHMSSVLHVIINPRLDRQYDFHELSATFIHMASVIHAVVNPRLDRQYDIHES